MNYIDFLAIIALIVLGIKGATALDRWEYRMDNEISNYADYNALRAVEDERLAVFQDPDEPYDWEADEDDEV